MPAFRWPACVAVPSVAHPLDARFPLHGSQFLGPSLVANTLIKGFARTYVKYSNKIRRFTHRMIHRQGPSSPRFSPIFYSPFPMMPRLRDHRQKLWLVECPQALGCTLTDIADRSAGPSISPSPIQATAYRPLAVPVPRLAMRRSSHRPHPRAQRS